LSEQAANAIGANAVISHVAALYHDIGKVLNPAFFTENQRDMGNPHDALNDPYRSADIIISHVTEGDEMARQYRLPKRLRDFIKEHHGTTQVYVFYRQAVAMAGDDESAVDIKDFTYPGPRPQSRETAIMMLADSCEATIRSMHPGSKQEIEEAVEKVIEGKRRDGQLDESGLTLNDLSTIKRIFVDMLKAAFHPRINYTEAVARARSTSTVPVIKPPAPAPVVATTTRTIPAITPRTTAQIKIDERPDPLLRLSHGCHL
jgi:putative nucleotidyltransferase with HDIG domain